MRSLQQPCISAQRGWRSAGLGVMGFAAVPGIAQSGMFDCTTPDGRLVYGDKPRQQDVATGQVTRVGAAGLPASSTGTARALSVRDYLNKAQREREQASLSPECRSLGGRTSGVLQSDSDARTDEVKRAVRAFEGRCGGQRVVTPRKESASVSGNYKPDAAACCNLRQASGADRSCLGRMTDKVKMAFVAQQNEVSVARC